jgi:hypothetical protein
MTFPRRNQYRHTLRAVSQLTRAGLACAAGFGFLALASATAADRIWAALLAVCGCLLLGLALLSARRAGREMQIAQQNRVGADSEDLVSVQLRVLCSEGWRLVRSLDWPGPGDIDNAIFVPGEDLVFAVETKTQYYLREALSLARTQASWLCRKYGCSHGAVAVLVLARRRDIERLEDGVLVVSGDVLVDALRVAARASSSTGASSLLGISERAAHPAVCSRERKGEGLPAPPGAGVAAPRLAPDAMLAPIARHLAEHRQLLAAEDELADILEQLDGDCWQVERRLRVDGMSTFLLLGAGGVFLLAASREHWTMEQIDALNGAASTVAAVIPGYPGVVRVIVALIGVETTPRLWCTARGACASVIGARGLLTYLATVDDHGFSPADLRRLRALSSEHGVSDHSRGLLPRGQG